MDEQPVIRQGDIYSFDFGPKDGSAPAGRRPCVVVQGDVFNRSPLHTTVVCVITTNMRRALAGNNVALRAGEGGLREDSVVIVSQLVTLNKVSLYEKTGRLPAERIDEIRAGIEKLTRRVGAAT